MHDPSSTIQELLEENASLKQRIQDLEQSETNRIRVEEARQNSEEMFRSLFETSQDAIFIVDQKTGSFLSANNAACRLYGYSKAEFLRMKHFDISAETDISKMAVQNSITKVPLRLHRKKDGTVFPVEIAGGYFDQGGRALHTAFIRDITERKRTENILNARLRLTEVASSSSLERLAQTVLDEICAQTDSPIGFFHNVEADEHTISLQAWSTYTLEKMCSAEGRGRHYDIGEAGVWVDCVRRRGPVVHNDYANLSHRKGLPAGHAPVIREMVFPIIRNHKIVAIIGVGNKSEDYTDDDVENASKLADLAWDIVEQKRTDEALQWQTALLEAQVNTSIDGILVVDETQKRVLTNKQLVDLWNIPQHILDDKEDTALLYYVVSQVKYPEEFMKKVTYLYDHPDETSVDELELKNGMVLDRYSAPVLGESGCRYGRIWTFRDVTDRKQAEEALKQSEHLYRTIFENTGTATVVLEKDTTISLINTEYEKLSGYQREEIEGKKLWTEFVLQEDLERLLTRPDLQGKDGSADRKRDEFRFVDRYGNIKYVALCFDRIPDTKKTIASLLDITERKRAEEALQESEERYRLLFEEAIEGIFRTTLDGRTIMINSAMARMIGFDSPQEAVEKITDIGSQIYADPEERQALIDRLLREGGVTGNEVLLKRLDGSTMKVLLNCRVVPDQSGTPVFIEGSCIDITDKWLAEEALKASEKKYRQIFEEAVEGIYQTTPGGRVLSANPAFARMCGYASPQEMIDSITDIVQQLYVKPADREKLIKILREHDQVEGYEVELYRRDGSRFWSTFNIHAVRDDLGEILYFEGTNTDITARKEAEDELRNLVSIVMNSSELISLATLDGKMIFLNEAGSRMLGIEPAKVSEFNIQDVIPEPFLQMAQTGILRALTKVGSWKGELRYRNIINGDLIDVHAMIFIISDPVSKTPLYLANVSRDITEYKQAVEALRASEELYARLVDTIPDVIIRTDLKGKILFVNDQALNISGYSRAEIEGQDLLFFVAPENRGRLTQNVWLMRKVRVGPQEYKFVMKDGREITFEVNGDLLRNEDGTPFGIVTVWRDLTERKQMEESLREESIRRQILFDQSPDGILIIDPETARFQDFNRAAHQQLGYSREEFTQLSIFDVEVEETAEETKAHIAEVIRNGRADFETLQRTRNGELRNVQVTVQIVDIQGYPAYHCIWRDITERITAERERRRLEKQIQQAQKMEAIGTLAGGIAHDFNNILGGIMGYTELCLDGVKDRPKIQNFMEQVLRATDRARELVQQILTFSRKVEQEKRPVMLVPIVKEVIKFMRASLPATIEIRQAIEETHHVIMADPIQMHQVLMNLCTNAGHAMKENGGTLEIGLKEVTLDTEDRLQQISLKIGCYLELSVRDTGHGIPQENLERIFEPYFTTKEKGEGTGLGLSVVHGIVQDHGGEIKAYSTEGQGTLFKVYIPLIAKQTVAGKEVEEPIQRGKGELILLVDDEPMMVILQTEILEGLGYRVVGKTDPVQAFETFRNNSGNFDIVITDKTMPHMTGIDLIRQIRDIRTDIPIVICSGFQEKEDMEKLRILGISQILPKPTVRRVLSKTIRDALDKREG